MMTGIKMDDFVGEEIETVVTQGFFGVYDGHGGSTTAHFLAEHLHVNCAANPGCYSGDLNEMTDAIRDGCEKTENVRLFGVCDLFVVFF